MRTPRACIVAVGTELVSGRRLDVNGQYLSHVLMSLGCEIQGRYFVPDNEDRIASLLASVLASHPEVVIVAGGLGPTDDDRTRDGSARALEAPLRLDADLEARIVARYRERGREIPEGARRQAFAPTGARIVTNPIGTTPGFVVEKGKSLVVALPGVPRELKAMFERDVLPSLRRTLAGACSVRGAILHVVGVSESDVSRLAFEGVLDHERTEISLRATAGEVEVRINVRADEDAEAERDLERLVTGIAQRLGDHVYGRDDDTLVHVVGRLLHERNYTLACAESCTGGMLAKTITDVAGVSSFYRGGVVPYDNDLKTALLGVPTEILERCGSVSGDVAAAMATGARARLGVDVAISTTGIAGPQGGSADKPVGLVYIGVETPDARRVTRHVLTGDREAIRRWASKYALDQVRRVLRGLRPLGEEVAFGENCP